MSDSVGVRVVVVAVMVLAACGGDDGPSRADVMAVVAADAVTRFESLVAATHDVATSVDTACADPTAADIAAARGDRRQRHGSAGCERGRCGPVR